MTTPAAPTKRQRRKLKSHFAYARLPFSKTMWASHMFDSLCQRDLLDGLHLWLEVRGLALVTGQGGVGKSITLRRFISELDDAQFRVFDFTYLPSTVTGFFRSLCRKLGLPLRQHTTDLFDAVKDCLATFEQETGPHPLLVIDDADGLSAPVVDALRRLTAQQLDGEDRFNLLLSGTDDLLALLRHPSLETLRSRFSYTQSLRPFTLEDTRNYVRFHLERAELDGKTFSDEATKHLFSASKGIPRNINQLATQALIQAAVAGRDTIDGRLMTEVINAHPLYPRQQGEPA
jgi:general secretion pathway protein A